MLGSTTDATWAVRLLAAGLVLILGCELLPPPSMALAQSEAPAIGRSASGELPSIQYEEDPPPGPFYKRWWFWTIIGALAAFGIAALIIHSTDKKAGSCPNPQVAPCP
jgi:hypothetical protein